MTVYFFVKQNISSATARYRGYLMAQELNKMGIKAIVCDPLGSRSAYSLKPDRFRELFKNFKILFFAKSDDIFYLVRTVYQVDFFILIIFFKIFFKRKFIFDFDDPIFLRPNKRRRMTWLVKISDAVMVGSHCLADWASKYNKNVFIIPTSVRFGDYARYNQGDRPKNTKFTLGWIGSGPNHYDNLKILVPVFEELIKQKIVFRFILVGSLNSEPVKDLFRKITGLDVEFIDSLNWVDSDEAPKTIQGFDIGLMPLEDNKWNRGKCAFKTIEYMACAVPAIISPVGENNYVIQDGQNGFLAKDKIEWCDKIKKIVFDQNLKIRLGATGQQTIKEKYSYESNVPKLIEIFNNL